MSAFPAASTRCVATTAAAACAASVVLGRSARRGPALRCARPPALEKTAALMAVAAFAASATSMRSATPSAPASPHASPAAWPNPAEMMAVVEAAVAAGPDKTALSTVSASPPVAPIASERRAEMTAVAGPVDFVQLGSRATRGAAVKPASLTALASNADPTVAAVRAVFASRRQRATTARGSASIRTIPMPPMARPRLEAMTVRPARRRRRMAQVVGPRMTGEPRWAERKPPQRTVPGPRATAPPAMWSNSTANVSRTSHCPRPLTKRTRRHPAETTTPPAAPPARRGLIPARWLWG
ncbi:MAG: hypothetical protein ACI9WU_004106 [Myxococcota bacterium]|jgi:hypothetical protein